MKAGTAIRRSGMVLHDKDGWVLRCDEGGRLALDVRRLAGADLAPGHATIIGIHVSEDLVDVTGIVANP